MATEIELHLRGNIAEIVMTPSAAGRPPTLDHDTLERLDRQLASLEQAGETVRLVVLRSMSPKYFCVGADLNALQHLNAESIASWVEHGHRVFNRLENLPLPVVAQVEGYALGGGLELALAADFIWATPEARLGQTEARLGFVAGWGGSARLPCRVGVPRAKELFFTARIVTATEAAGLGLVDHCASKDALDARLREFADEIAACSPLAVRELKRLVARAIEPQVGTSELAEAAASIECVQSKDTQGRVAAFLSRRHSKGHSASEQTSG